MGYLRLGCVRLSSIHFKNLKVVFSVRRSLKENNVISIKIYISSKIKVGDIYGRFYSKSLFEHRPLPHYFKNKLKMSEIVVFVFLLRTS